MKSLYFVGNRTIKIGNISKKRVYNRNIAMGWSTLNCYINRLHVGVWVLVCGCVNQLVRGRLQYIIL